jgi:hypothetical protein
MNYFGCEYFFYGTEAQTQGFTLAKQVLYLLIHTSFYFALAILEMEVSQTIWLG